MSCDSPCPCTLEEERCCYCGSYLEQHQAFLEQQSLGTPDESLGTHGDLVNVSPGSSLGTRGGMSMSVSDSTRQPWDVGLFVHKRMVSAVGEACQMCGNDAWHKVEECDARPHRHPWSAYLCCLCFGKVMGPVAREWCGLNNPNARERALLDRIMPLDDEPPDLGL